MVILALSVFAGLLLFFSLSELFLAYWYHPKDTSIYSMCLSPQFLIFMGLALAEFLVESWLVPSVKYAPIMILGFFVTLFGEIIRKTAIITAGHNFTHLIAEEKKETHTLVRHGIYRFFRHPSYFGWFWWAVGTQIMLCNPVCVAAFAYVSWYFFYDRIRYEEYYLVRFFGQEYEQYRKEVPTRIPFIP
ncbi:putative protein-S-isoprenylcysteine O-methyltransferase [Paratrimastix pyriformis]|uniref:Protein-S-isoprenylcysteine O-methyltransferase n=1 Tax=Paratrimastix pyriformis TaxID=342808 RepID=A0ABQ8ULQ5_9EUKA|nr:putative protein-S-isoprenylcysteine O-methyltransferase [Paratrimastix pyriformis]